MKTFEYHIASDRGYWLPQGYGYTKSLTEAGRFTVADMAAHNLDGCTLHRVQVVTSRAKSTVPL